MTEPGADAQTNREEGEEEDPETVLLGERVDENNGDVGEEGNDTENPIEADNKPTEEVDDIKAQDPSSNDVKSEKQAGTEEDQPVKEENKGSAEEQLEEQKDANTEPVAPTEQEAAEPQDTNNEESQAQNEPDEHAGTQTEDTDRNVENTKDEEEPSVEDQNVVGDVEKPNEVAEKANNTPEEPNEPKEIEEEQPSERSEIKETEGQDKEQPDDQKHTTDEKNQSMKEETVEIPTASPEPDTDNVGTGTEPTDDKHETDPHAPSPVSRYDHNATATVKFVLMPSGQVATMRCLLGQALGQLKGHFATELKIAADVILMLFDGKNMSDETTLGDLGVGPNGTIQLEIQSADPVNHPIKPVQRRTEYHMPDVITVRVQTDDGTMQDVVVEIERPLRKKPFLGGYRHKKTGVEYHHASAQTMAKQKAQSITEKYCRDTQTVQQRHQVQQTTNAMSTQMTKIGVYVSNMEDKLMAPGRYTTAADHQKRRLENVIVIQKYFRRWLAMRTVEKVRDDMAARLEWEREDEIRKRKEKEDRIRREFERRMNPKSREDFDLLYHALEKWRKEELDRINSTLSGAERKAALCVLLEQETQLIGSIGRHKLDAEGENRLNKIQNFLDKAAAPKRWKGPDGNVTEMDTPYTLRAQQLRDIYNTINMKYLTQDERLDVLLTLKHTVKEHDCKLTQEIVELIDREADLLMRGVKESNLEGLRKRISTLFLQYCKTPVFNPEIARLLKVPQDSAALRSNIYFCSSCNQYLPSTDFQLSSNSDTVGRCKRCLKMDNDSRVRQDYSHYRYMLKALRRSEENYCDDSKIAFLLQESDLRYLVENVWNSQSAISAWDDLYDLVLVRWERHSEWSPWNCCLLTKEEASAHEKLQDLTEAYGKTFIHKVKHKHTLARNYFSRLPGMAEHLRKDAAEKSQAASQAPSITGKAVPIRVT